MHWLLLFVALAIIGTGVYLIITAPEGYEDDNGFHYGRTDEPDKDFF